MADANDVRRLALALPHVEEIESDGFDFRVADKGFVWSYPERRAGKPRVIRTDIAVLFVGDEAEKQALLLGEPEVFFTTSGYDGFAAGDAAADRGGRRTPAGARDRRVADACPGRACRRPRRDRRSIERRSGLSEARSLNATGPERRTAAPGARYTHTCAGPRVFAGGRRCWVRTNVG